MWTDRPESIQFIEKDSRKYVFGGMEPHATNILRVISDLESAYQMLKYCGFKEDMETLEEINIAEEIVYEVEEIIAIKMQGGG